jgi:acetyl-CoA synthetase
VALVDGDGREVEAGEVGEVVVGKDDPTLFLGYWNQPALSEAMKLGESWIRTHDLARRDADGYYWYQGRNDDLIKSAGFRIGPAEVEEALLQHPAVADSGVIGVPDREGDRGTVVKAFIRLADGHSGNDTLAEELRQHVKHRIGAYKQPRLVEFVTELPTTRTGKIARAELRAREAELRKANNSSSKQNKGLIVSD